MRHNKTAQLSIETMIIYGLIILVTLSVAGILMYFNVLDLGSYLPDSCDLGGTGDLKCEEMQFSSTTHTLQLGIRNVGQKPIDLLNVAVEDKGKVHFSGTPNADGEYTPSGTTTSVTIDATHSLPPGEIAKVTIDTTSAVKGKVLRGILYTKYKFTEGIITQEATGSIRIKAS
jgi:archaellum component FlaG (FlaF/FlaG flagellin family)